MKTRTQRYKNEHTHSYEKKNTELQNKHTYSNLWKQKHWAAKYTVQLWKQEKISTGSEDYKEGNHISNYLI